METATTINPTKRAMVRVCVCVDGQIFVLLPFERIVYLECILHEM